MFRNIILLLALISAVSSKEREAKTLPYAQPQIFQTITISDPTDPTSNRPLNFFNNQPTNSNQFVPSLPNRPQQPTGLTLNQLLSGVTNPHDFGYTKIPWGNKGFELAFGPFDHTANQNPIFFLNENGVPQRVRTETTYRLGIRNPLYNTLKRAKYVYKLLNQFKFNGGANILANNILAAQNPLGLLNAHHIG